MKCGDKKIILLCVTILAIMGSFFILNKYTPLYADDYSYSFSFYSGKRIESVEDIALSQITHYQMMNGRSVTHFLAQLFLQMGDKIFNVINTFAFMLLLLLLIFHARGRVRGGGGFFRNSILFDFFMCTRIWAKFFMDNWGGKLYVWYYYHNAISCSLETSDRRKIQ